jgi:hypothetical protein
MPHEPEPQAEQQRISEQDVRRVLERAIQLDAARAGETTVAELHRVAQELNITPASLSQALNELQSRALTTPPRSVPFAPETTEPTSRVERALGWMRTAMIGVGANMIGQSMNTVHGVDELTGVLLVTSAAVVGSTVLYRLTRKNAEHYLRDVAVFWAMFGLAWLLDAPEQREWQRFPGGEYEQVLQSLGIAPLAGVLFSWLATSTVGGFVMRFKWPWRKVEAKQGFAATA